MVWIKARNLLIFEVFLSQERGQQLKIHDSLKHKPIFLSYSFYHIFISEIIYWATHISEDVLQ